MRSTEMFQSCGQMGICANEASITRRKKLINSCLFWGQKRSLWIWVLGPGDEAPACQTSVWTRVQIPSTHIKLGRQGTHLKPCTLWDKAVRQTSCGCWASGPVGGPAPMNGMESDMMSTSGSVPTPTWTHTYVCSHTSEHTCTPILKVIECERWGILREKESLNKLDPQC